MKNTRNVAAVFFLAQNPQMVFSLLQRLNTVTKTLRCVFQINKLWHRR